MLPDLARRVSATGAVCFVTLAIPVVGCGEAVKTPFFEERTSNGGGTGATTQGGASGIATGGTTGGTVAAGGDAGAGLGGTASGGDAGMSGAGSGGVGATAGTGSGGVSGTGAGGAGVSGASGTDAGGTGGGVDCSSADPAAVAFDDHCYVLRATPRTWAQARDDCASDGAHLVTVSSQGRTEAQFLAENAFVWMLGGAIEKWIGATDGRPSNQTGNGTPYTWITGEPMTYDLWSGGQPNNAQSACMDDAPCPCGDMCWEHCGFQWDPDNDEPGTWNDRHCEHLVAYVCEWDTPPP
jgi:hypothetical protein